MVISFLINAIGSIPIAKATELLLPAPGQMVALSPAFNPVVLKGIKLDPDNPFRFNFFVDTGDSGSVGNRHAYSNLRQESEKLIKYFLASLTIPEKDLWVNLSPYEKDRIVPKEFGQTEMGRDMLAQDYLLKQITASLIYPEDEFGKKFWKRIYEEAAKKFGTTNIPINTFNKVWIVPDKAVVYENNGTAFVLENHLKVMLEEDYLAGQKNNVETQNLASLSKQIIKEIVIPALTKEVNEGKNFSQLRQVFYSLILATWYKKKISAIGGSASGGKDSILNKVYVNQKKINGVNVSKQDKIDIYQQYLQAFKKGVYNYIKEEPDQVTGQNIPRKYFSGGVIGRLKPSENLFFINQSSMSNSQKEYLNAAQLVSITGDMQFKMNQAMNISQDLIDRLNQLKLDLGANPQSVDTVLPYKVFKEIFDATFQHKHMVDQLKGNEKDNLTLVTQVANETSGLMKVLNILNEDILKGYLRKYLIENTDLEGFYSFFEFIFQHKDNIAHILWQIYLNSRNSPAENHCLAQALINTTLYNVRGALLEIMSIFMQGKIDLSHKALQILLKLNIAKEDQVFLFEVISTAGPYKEIVATYYLAHMRLFGVETETTRDGFDNTKLSNIKQILSKQAGNIYFYLLNAYAILKQGGIANVDVDHRIFKYSKFLDNNASSPGIDGYTWFSVLREKIHTSFDQKYLYLVQGILDFWKTKDTQVLTVVEQKVGMEWSISTSIVQDTNVSQYAQILNNTLNLLEQRGDISSTQVDFHQIILGLDENRVIEALTLANEGKFQHDIEKVEYMIRLCFALNEKFNTSLPLAIKGIKGETNNLLDQGHKAKMLVEHTQFAHQQYQALLQALNGNDDRLTLAAVADLRLSIRNYLLTDKVDQSDGQVNGLLGLDHHLHILGHHLLNTVFNQHIQGIATGGDIDSNYDILIAAAKFIHAEGLGGVDFEQFLDELEHGDLTYIQMHNLVRALQTEVLKATQKINQNVRRILPSVVTDKSFRGLSPEWRDKVKTETYTYTYEGEQYTSERISSHGTDELQSAFVDDVIRDSGIDVLKATLTKIDQILENQLPQQENQLMHIPGQAREPIVEQPIDLNQHFLRFGPQVLVQNGTLPLLLRNWGKKLLNILMMCKAGIPVPQGVGVSSQLMTRPDIIHSDAFKVRVKKEIEELRKFSKYPDLKLLLYARSGSAFMLPGLMSTISNIGMNDREVVELAKSTGDVWFAYDTYASFIRAFAVYVFGIDEGEFQSVLDDYPKDKTSPEDMQNIVEGYKQIVQQHGNGRIIPETMIDQVIMAMEAVYASWDSPKAKAYRHKHRISQRWGTAVILQKGVFGNMNTTDDGNISGVGSATLMTAPDGRMVLQGEFRYRGQGDQIMSQAHQNTVSIGRDESPLKNGQTLEELNPELYQEVLAEALKVKDLSGYDPLLEFVFERGELSITQSNDDFMREDFPQFAEHDVLPIIRGKGLSGGAVRGWVANSIEEAERLFKKYKALKAKNYPEVKDIDGVILIQDRINPEMIGLIPEGVHILAKKLSVHAMTLAQTAGISVVAEIPDDQMIFNENLKTWSIAGNPLANGDIISMDGHRNGLIYHTSGNIYLGSVPLKTDKEQKDKAVVSKEFNLTKGGIDFDPAQMNMQVKQKGQEFRYNFNGPSIDPAQVTGAEFIIDQMTPITNLPQVLGLQ